MFYMDFFVVCVCTHYDTHVQRSKGSSLKSALSFHCADSMIRWY